MGNGYVKQARLVIVLALCFGAALVGVETALGRRIAENKRRKTHSKFPELVPGADAGEQCNVGSLTVYRAMRDRQQVGWAIPTSGQGFADKIELLIGLDLEGETITGMAVLDQKETPGLGNKIQDAKWREQFRKKSTSAPLTVTKSAPRGNEIQAVSGATISSRSVCEIVNRAVQEFREQLAQVRSKQ